METIAARVRANEKRAANPRSPPWNPPVFCNQLNRVASTAELKLRVRRPYVL
jgi:hypothetical protein